MTRLAITPQAHASYAVGPIGTSATLVELSVIRSPCLRLCANHKPEGPHAPQAPYPTLVELRPCVRRFRLLYVSGFVVRDTCHGHSLRGRWCSGNKFKDMVPPSTKVAGRVCTLCYHPRPWYSPYIKPPYGVTSLARDARYLHLASACAYRELSVK